jgi:hypothetical protein
MYEFGSAAATYREYLIAKYEPTSPEITLYTATFMADGKVVGTVQFTVEDTKLAEPAVPAKEGYTGAWESYTITAADMTINAVYTAEGPVEPVETKTWILWLIIAILCIIIIVLIVLLVLKRNKDDDDDKPEPPAPVVVPAPEPEPEAEPTPAAEPTSVAPAPAPIKVTVLTATSRAIINLSDLDANFNEGDTVTLEILKAKKLVSSKEKRLKILATGTLTKALTVEADYFSGSAKASIEAAGGTAVQKD